MTRRFLPFACTLVAALAFMVMPGCNSGSSTNADKDGSAEHDGHDHDEDGHEEDGHGEHKHEFATLAEALPELESLKTALGEAIAAKDGKMADDVIHHLADVINGGYEMADKLAEAESEATKDALDKFREAFDEVHSLAHDAKPMEEIQAAWDKAKQPAEDAFAELKKMAESTDNEDGEAAE